MDPSTILAILLGAPLAAALLMFALPSQIMPRAGFALIHFLSITTVMLSGLYLVVVHASGAGVFAFGGWLHLDVLSAVFITLISIIAFATGLHAIGYIGKDAQSGKLAQPQVKLFYALFSLFMFTMLLAVLSNNIIMTWIAIEATTLSTVFLVGIYRDKPSLEAAWKYVVVCTVLS